MRLCWLCHDMRTANPDGMCAMCHYGVARLTPPSRVAFWFNQGLRLVREFDRAT